MVCEEKDASACVEWRPAPFHIQVPAGAEAQRGDPADSGAERVRDMVGHQIPWPRGPILRRTMGQRRGLHHRICRQREARLLSVLPSLTKPRRHGLVPLMPTKSLCARKAENSRQCHSVSRPCSAEATEKHSDLLQERRLHELATAVGWAPPTVCFAVRSDAVRRYLQGSGVRSVFRDDPPSALTAIAN